jgi:3-hydroxyisobutyrate dehydrogenase
MIVRLQWLINSRVSLNFSGPDSAAAAATKASIVVLMLPDSSIVDHLLWQGDEALSRVLKSGALIIDMSSSDLMHTRQNAEKLTQLDIGFIDAPVSGGVKRAAQQVHSPS